MNAPVEFLAVQAQRLQAHIDTATARIAPTWPLDEFIAVNPYWGWVDQPIAQASAALGVLAGTSLTMPRAWYAEQWRNGDLQPWHLRAAVLRSKSEGAAQSLPITGSLAHTGLEEEVEQLVQALGGVEADLNRLPLITDLRDRAAEPRPGLSWSDLVTHQVSQHCAAYFDRHQATWGLNTTHGLYGSWLRHLEADHGLPWQRGRASLQTRLAQLPTDPRVLIAEALAALEMPESGRDAYLSAVLSAIGGWGAWCSFERWQARLRGGDDDSIEHLLAIRLAWEWLLKEDASPGEVPLNWAQQWSGVTHHIQTLHQSQRMDWLLQDAVEIAFQQTMVDGLGGINAARDCSVPSVQAVFCIDVRSEVFRRALESASPEIHTRGFAGFFGLPIAYSPIGSALTRPQLPGLLAPAQCVTERVEASLGQVLAARRKNALQWRQRWTEFRSSPSSGFSFVESMGLVYGAKLLADSLASTKAPASWEAEGLPKQKDETLRPCLPLTDADPGAAAAMAKGILVAMGLQSGFAPLVMLVGHGSRSANNPHAAGLDCGACGGQTGEVNARALADLLNTPQVRTHLRALGVDVPERTRFLAALHNTTTDEVALYDTGDVSPHLHADLTRLQGWLDYAGVMARAERSNSLGLGHLKAQEAALKKAVLQRANHWAEVRPEWGLVNNAAFVVAPRSRTRHLKLSGRCFLHDYDQQNDPDLGVLTLIMTAPMVVTNWINMQYHASTVDNRRYGSGNKVLHNVVGGRLGVFEGNGGDLRIGLPMQSLHDGHRLHHTPLRLSVFIEASRDAIDTVMSRHEIVKQLVNNGWLHLLRIDSESHEVEHHVNNRWQTFCRTSDTATHGKAGEQRDEFEQAAA